MHAIALRIFDQPIRLRIDDPAALQLVQACYSAFRDESAAAPDALEVDVAAASDGTSWTVSYGNEAVACAELADLAYEIEKGLTIELQNRRRDLLFLHAAAVDVNGVGTLITGESGAGKSTLCWGLCNEGCRYLSDELAPVRLDTLQIEPYPHAICLKSVPEGGYAAPPTSLRTRVTTHIPVESIPGGIVHGASELRNIVFLSDEADGADPGLEKIAPAEAAARLYVLSLNPLAHDKDGLAAAARVARAVSCFRLNRSDPAAMRRAILGVAGVV